MWLDLALFLGLFIVTTHGLNCGSYYGSQGVITSPNYPGAYVSNTDCDYTIYLASSTTVMITFSGVFYLESFCDYLQIDASYCQVDPNNFKITGSSVSRPTPSSSVLWFPSCSTQISMRFHTDGSVEGYGFNLTYSSSGACRMTYTEPQGTLSSPNHPYNYLSNLDCTYTIDLNRNFAITLEFSTTFWFDSSFDYIKVDASSCQDGGNSSFTGRTAPGRLSYSTCRRVQIQFHTDASGVGPGFSLSYATGGCGPSNFTGSHGTITSPNFPSPYLPYTDCSYRIVMNSSSPISLEFSSTFTIGAGDYFKVDAGACQGGTVSNFTGSTAPATLSFSSCNRIDLLFHSNGSVEGAGFKLVYTTGGCGRTNFTESRGIITSPSYPNPYLSNIDCHYTVALISHTAITLTFARMFDLQPCCDNVQVDASACWSGGIYSFNGSTAPSALSFASCKLIEIHFHANGSGEGAGFRLEYATGGCGQSNFFATRGTIVSPNFPSPYLPNTNCVYTIISSGNNTQIELNFSRTFNIRNCCDYIKVDGSDCFNGTINTFTGSTAPGTIFLYSCHQVRIQFHSDSSAEGAGFNLEYAVEDMNECDSTNWNNCDGRTEDCLDLVGSYRCVCKLGYSRSSTHDKCFSDVTTTVAGLNNDSSADVKRWIGIAVGSGLFVLIAVVVFIIIFLRRKSDDRLEQNSDDVPKCENNVYVMDDDVMMHTECVRSGQAATEERIYDNLPPRQRRGKELRNENRYTIFPGSHIKPKPPRMVVERSPAVYAMDCIEDGIYENTGVIENTYETLNNVCGEEHIYESASTLAAN